MFNFKVQGNSQEVATLDSDGVKYEVVSVAVTDGQTYGVVVSASAKYENYARLGGFVFGCNKQQSITGLAIL